MTTQTQRLPIDVIDLIATAAIKYQVFQLAPGTVRSTRIITAAAQQLGDMLHAFGDPHGLQDYQFQKVTTPVDFRDVLAACQLAEAVHQNHPDWETSTSAAVVRNIARAAENVFLVTRPCHRCGRALSGCSWPTSLGGGGRPWRSPRSGGRRTWMRWHRAGRIITWFSWLGIRLRWWHRCRRGRGCGQ